MLSKIARGILYVAAMASTGCATTRALSEIYIFSKTDVHPGNYQIFSIDERISVARRHIRTGKEFLGYGRTARSTFERIRNARTREEGIAALLQGAGLQVENPETADKIFVYHRRRSLLEENELEEEEFGAPARIISIDELDDF
ncbi:MAG: hypothetical protein QW331_01085 [Candidatus Woesearchaeota archaeon]